jgi:hypothetical protein
MILGGALVVFGYLFWVGHGLAPGWPPVTPEGPVDVLSIANYGIDALLLAVGLATLLLPSLSGRLSGSGVVGGWLLVSGFGLWTLGAGLSFSPVRLPWWFIQLSPILIMLGSPLFGAAALLARVVPPAGPVLVGVFGLIGMALIEGPELAWGLTGIDVQAGIVVHILAFLALVLFGVGWVLLGSETWRGYLEAIEHRGSL